VDFESLRAVPNPKEVVDTLEVVTKSGQCVKITTDPGLPFLGFWNGLLAAMQIAPKE
jgi:hypothetical protein